MNPFMKRILSISAFLFAAVLSHAQGQGISYQYQEVRVKAKVLDSKTATPVPYATVYLIPQGDTTITDFAISNEKGDIVLEKVAAGRYELNAELLGYKTFTKNYDIYQAPGWDLDLGTIGMEESTESIDASTITAAGNPITIEDDKVIYNASSFRVGENAVLEDLLKKMPGIQVSDDGSATVNGEKVDRITVDGKTFFFGDPSMAIKNLPAKIVERISVSRQETKSDQMQGIGSGFDKETVMDVELKEEYKEGWFGDARLGAGATLNGNDGSPLTEGSKALFDGNLMASLFGEKDQAVFIANGYNTQRADGNGSASDLAEDDYSDLGGLTTAVRGGANYNTSRIKGFETTVSANYRHAGKEDTRRSSRTSFVPGGNDLLTDGGTDASGKEDQLVLDAELSKMEGKVLVDFTPRFYFRKSGVNSTNYSNTYHVGGTSPLSSMTASSFSDNRQLLADGTLDITGRDLGKDGRRVGFSLDYGAGASNGNRSENSLQILDYDLQGKMLDLTGRVFYYEPVGERWGVQAEIASLYNSRFNDRAASDADGRANDYYTSRTDQRFKMEQGSLMMQYSNDTSTVQVGIKASAFNDIMDATMLGINTVSGKDDWRFNISPLVSYSFDKDGHQLMLQYTSVTSQASSRQMIPVPDISNPALITTGNTYLKSGIDNSLMAYYNMVNYATYTFLTLYANAELESNGTVYASWFDNKGIRYAVPVNAKKPGAAVNAYGMLNQPFGKQKNFTLSLAAQLNYSDSQSYQATALQPGLDLDNFDYRSFMDGFWGGSTGDRFYSGESGFASSRTRSFDWGVGLDLKYNKDFFTGTISAGVWNGRASYSLSPGANMNTWTNNIGCDLLFQPGKGWEFGTDARYYFFRGYAPGFGDPELRWNLSAGKTVKSVTFSLKMNDVLNQERSLSRIVSSEYMEDSYRNVLGRHILFGISFNFGKLNTNKSSAVSNAINKLDY